MCGRKRRTTFNYKKTSTKRIFHSIPKWKFHTEI
ncbi:hypothetical protein LSS_21630 [Leptospira santarosai serovar Shermani str. LT 821]|uniref:Uncharacterized protein n=1 Tax=Leptospira santarosai serovar Shermani str. LT 821 TaxID=758847 RepID=A0A097ESI5_9LEPT|nr:hypothetical protein LSS_21630 [Leptospira santarosai serovar Shermani str. LT 821]